MNLKFTKSSFNMSEHALPVDAISPSQELSDEELEQVYGGQGMNTGSGGTGMGRGMYRVTGGSSAGGRKGYFILIALDGSHHWNRWRHYSYGGGGGGASGGGSGDYDDDD